MEIRDKKVNEHHEIADLVEPLRDFYFSIFITWVTFILKFVMQYF